MNASATVSVVTIDGSASRHIPGLLADEPLIVRRPRRANVWNVAPERPACAALRRARALGMPLSVVLDSVPLADALIALQSSSRCHHCSTAAARDIVRAAERAAR